MWDGYSFVCGLWFFFVCGWFLFVVWLSIVVTPRNEESRFVQSHGLVNVSVFFRLVTPARFGMVVLCLWFVVIFSLLFIICSGICQLVFWNLLHIAHCKIHIGQLLIAYYQLTNYPIPNSPLPNSPLPNYQLPNYPITNYPLPNYQITHY